MDNVPSVVKVAGLIDGYRNLKKTYNLLRGGVKTVGKVTAKVNKGVAGAKDVLTKVNKGVEAVGKASKSVVTKPTGFVPGFTKGFRSSADLDRIGKGFGEVGGKALSYMAEHPYRVGAGVIGVPFAGGIAKSWLSKQKKIEL